MKRVLAFLLCAATVFCTLFVCGVTAADHIHQYEWRYPAGSSCEDDRLFINVCALCGDVCETREVSPGGHVPIDGWTVIVPATVDSKGMEAVLCSECDAFVSTRETDALEVPGKFGDVPDDSWFAHAADFCYAQGLFSGTGGGLFSPSVSMTRAMFVTVAASLCGVDREEYNYSMFADVPKNSWYTGATTWAASAGIVSGTGNNNFSPGQVITREQTALILFRLAEYSGISVAPDVSVLDAYSDAAQISAWAREALAWAVGEGLMTGYGGMILPKGEASRSQVAQIIMNFYKTLYLPSLADRTAYIGDVRKLIVEDDLTDHTLTTAQMLINNPRKREKVFSFDAVWESADAVYHNILKMPDGTYRMYYKATSNIRRICYIESTDGLTWTRPDVGTYYYNGEGTNCVTSERASPDNLFVFYDSNPACAEGERIKGIYGQWGDGLFLEYTSTEGKSFFEHNEAQIMGTPEETGGCFFDTLNTVYWDADRGKYVAFVRGFHQGDDYCLSKDYVGANPTLITRDIRYSESDDCINWTTPVPLKYSDTDVDDQHMYANCAMPYFRSSGLYVAIPTRYNIVSTDNGWVTAAYTDTMLMASRDLVNWTRYDCEYMLPHDPEEKPLTYGDCYPCVGMIPTSGKELSLYMKEKGERYTELYRYSLRIDGFASAEGDMETTAFVTKPFSFRGDELLVNYSTKDGGWIEAVITDEYGNSYRSKPLTGDKLDGAAAFGDGVLAGLNSKTITVTFELTNASLYSFKFD